MRSVSKLLCFFTAIITISGCGYLSGISSPSRGRIIDSASGADPSITPFRIDVLSESNQGEKLAIKGQLVPKTTQPSKDILIRLTALDKNGEQRISTQKLEDLVPNTPEIVADKPLEFSLAIPSEGISNYQLEVLWGKDAAPYLGDSRASMKQPEAPAEYLALRNLEVHRVPDGSCSSPEECLVTFSIKGEFFNAGRAVVREILLVAGFAPASKLDSPNHPLENERKIEIKNLNLHPQGSKPFRLSLEKLLPASDTVAYQPVVRILSFESQ